MYHHSENHPEVNGNVENTHMEALLRRHSELENRLATFKGRVVSNEDEIKQMKRQKVHLMDEIHRASA